MDRVIHLGFVDDDLDGDEFGMAGDVDDGRPGDAAEFGRYREALFFLQIEDRDLHALGGERARGGGAEARGAAGDDGGYGGIEFHGFLLKKALPFRGGFGWGMSGDVDSQQALPRPLPQAGGEILIKAAR